MVYTDKLHKKWLNNSLRFIRDYVREHRLPLKDSLEGQSNEVFVPLSANADAIAIGGADAYTLKTLSYKDIIINRASTVFGLDYGHFSREVKELAMSVKPVDVEVEFSRKPLPKWDLSLYTTPFGPRAPLKDLEFYSTPKIPKKVESLAEEKIKAKTALYELYERSYDPYYLQRTFSLGLFGVEKRLVPTRQAITATDDLLSKKNIEELKDYQTIGEYELYSYEHLYNRYFCILLPKAWAFENMESWPPGSSWGAKDKYRISVERELYRGRWRYAESQAGAYYATRFAVTEFLVERRRQAAVLCIREILPEYNVPVGVWQVREGVREAFKRPLCKCDNENLWRTLSKKLYLPAKLYKQKSLLFRQGILTDWM